ncbi:MAG TPA: alpha/beta fold hydrolase [Pseudogracilibacillus sp.]|nr:alpha/beta fold hydrolase [Pseudogracilibacillus sp.]
MIGCLIIHGFTGGPFEVEPLRAFLEERTDWKVLVPTLTGHGEELDLSSVKYEVWLEDAKHALHELQAQCETVYVVGFSMGGMIAAYLAGTENVDRLVLLATARKYLSFKYLSQYVAEVIGDGVKGKLEENEMYHHYKGKIGTVPLRANIEFMKLVNKTKDYLEEVTAPVFIAQGKRDGLVPYHVAYALEEEIASEEKEVVFFEQSKHLICLGNDSEILNKMIYQFLEEETETGA